MCQELCKGRQLSDLLGQRPIWLWTRGGAQDVLEHSHRSSMHAVCIQVKAFFPPAGWQFCRNTSRQCSLCRAAQVGHVPLGGTFQDLAPETALDASHVAAWPKSLILLLSMQRSKVIYTQSILAEQSTPVALLGCTERRIVFWQVKRTYAPESPTPLPPGSGPVVVGGRD